MVTLVTLCPITCKTVQSESENSESLESEIFITSHLESKFLCQEEKEFFLPYSAPHGGCGVDDGRKNLSFIWCSSIPVGE